MLEDWVRVSTPAEGMRSSECRPVSTTLASYTWFFVRCKHN